MGGNFDHDEGSVFAAMPPWPVGVQSGGEAYVIEQARHILGGTNVPDGHGQELFAGVAIGLDGGLVDGQEGQRFQVEYPHGLWIAFEQNAILAFGLLQRQLRQAAAGDVAKRQDHSGERATRAADGRGAVVDGDLPPVPRQQHGVVGQGGGLAGAEDHEGRVFDRGAGVLVDGAEDFADRALQRFRRGPPGQLFGHRIEKRDRAVGVGDHYGVPDAAQDGLQCGFTLGFFLARTLGVRQQAAEPDDAGRQGRQEDGRGDDGAGGSAGDDCHRARNQKDGGRSDLLRSLWKQRPHAWQPLSDCSVVAVGPPERR